MNSKTPALEITGLRCNAQSHWTYQKREILHGIDVIVEEGESFGFLGHNGAGKTTTIKCILGLLRPAAGNIKIFGKEASHPDARAAVGYLAEQPYFYDYLTVKETLEFYATLAGVAADKRSAEITRAAELVKISGRMSSPLRSLSKGLVQRVGMAQAIVARPKLLILDEPFSGLDPIGRKELRDLIIFLKGEGATTFMSSHILSDVEFLCNRVSILSNGALKGIFRMDEIPRLAGGSYELVIENSPTGKTLATECGGKMVSKENFIRIIFSDRPQAEQVLAQAIQQHIHVESFTFEQGSLEDLFVKLVTFDEGAGSSQHG